MTVLTKIFRVIFKFLGLKHCIALVPCPIVSNFVSKVKIVLVVLRLKPFLNRTAPGNNIINALADLPGLIDALSPTRITLKVFSLTILFLVPGRFGH